MSAPTENPDSSWINLASERLGSKVLSVSDEFFAPGERLIRDQAPVFIPDKYDDHGKWMDGWESRRRRGPGHDHCVVRLGLPGLIHGVDIDTRYFTGNFPPEASLDGCLQNADPGASARWTEILARTGLQGDSANRFEIEKQGPWSHVRLNIFPDGGVARLRVYGEACFDPSRLAAGETIDLAAMLHGGRALACSDEHYGAMQNLLLADACRNMGDGWETRRRRGPGHDWVIIKLGIAGRISRIRVGTRFFKGNFPDSVSVEGARLEAGSDPLTCARWQPILARQPLSMDAEHDFAAEQADPDTVTHVRINIFPDGGLSRVRIFGLPAA